MSKLGKKLFAVFLALVVFSLFLAGLFINFSIGERFDDFINLQRQDNIEELASMLAEGLETESFSSLESIVENFSRTNRILVWVEDENGNFLYFSAQNNQMSSMMRRMGMHGRNHMNMRPLPSDLPGLTRSQSVTLNGEEKLKLYWKEVSSANKLDSRVYEYFKENVFKAIILSTLIAVAVTTFFSFILSRKITAPLVKLKNAALEVAEGKYEQNISSKGDDELTELIQAFNTMSKKLFKLEKIRKESASDLAHELRTPLTTIKGYLEAIEDGKIKADSDNIKDLQEETARMTNLIEKLNEFGDAQNKAFDLKRQRINLEEIINKVIKQQAKFIQSKNINLELKFEKDLFIHGDQDSLVQIFNNIIENAVKYNKENGSIIIKSEKRNQNIVISIQDSGQGIKNEDLPYIFERFYRADKSRNSKNQGSGIGLAVVKELMEAHDAVVEVESNQQGALFKLIFKE